ncbi:DUF4179 domain-containing protein [Brevibacillus massiliensis]|uniref:DUF4179 domain-containing protein n=1 Tax=Brevibacillus massiliensis TaxID=1118054 RepID=UPI0002D50816|nr:DUF4179 domain-containing protein [Brevibacillus massiliensis]
MFDREEQVLRKVKEQIAGLPLPAPEQLDQAIERGMQRAKRKRPVKSWSLAVSAAVCVLCLLLAVSIRVSPAFATLVSELPGMSYIVKLISYDQGLQRAVEHDFVQPVGISDEKDGIRLTVGSIIADEMRLNIFYTAESTTGKPKKLLTSSVELLDGNRQPFSAGISSFSPEESNPDDHILKGHVDIHFIENKPVPDTVIMRVKLVGDIEHPDTVWEVTIPVDRSKFAGMKETVPIDQTVDIAGQKFTFTDAVIYPTRIRLGVEFDPDNTKNIMGFEDLKIVNEKGDVLKTDLASVGESKQTIYFESSYFTEAKELYLRGSELMALDKDKSVLVIDVGEKKLLKAPDQRVHLESIDRGTAYTTINLLVEKLPGDKHAYSIVDSEFADAAGNVYQTEGNMGIIDDDSSIQRTSFHIKSEDYTGPLTFTITNYPARITQPFEVRLK